MAQFHQVDVLITNCSSVSTFAYAGGSSGQTDAATLSSAFFLDKPDCRRVIFYGLPLSLESFMQLSSDAGRDGGPAAVCLYWSASEYQSTHDSLSSLTTGESARRHLWKLDNVKAYAEARGCRKDVLRRYFDWHPNGASGSVIAHAQGSPVKPWSPAEHSTPLWPAHTESYVPGAEDGRQCGQCDNCLLEHPNLRAHSHYTREDAALPTLHFVYLDVGDSAYLLLSALHQTGSRHPIDVPIGVVRGEHMRSVLCPGFQRLTVFGRGAALSFRYWLTLSDILIGRGYIDVVSAAPPAGNPSPPSVGDCVLTHRGLAFLKSQPVTSPQPPPPPSFASLLSELPEGSLWAPAMPREAADASALAYASALYGRPLLVDSDEHTAQLQWLQLQSAQVMGLRGADSLTLSNVLPCEMRREDQQLYLELNRLTDHQAYNLHIHPLDLLRPHQLATLALFRPIDQDGLLRAACACGLSGAMVESWAARLVAHIVMEEQLRALSMPIASDPPEGADAVATVDRVGAGGPAVRSVSFFDVFPVQHDHLLFSSSRPVRQINHAQMIVWQAFEAGETVRQISDSRSMKPHIVLAYIIYCLESYSPSPSHPVFVHWTRFSIPPEIMDKG